MVEAMKYPTSAGQATTELLKALENAGLGAPGAAAGLYANLDWVARTYPSIDLEAPPACLPPARPNLVCPSVAR
jgi:hypothetical protein